MQDLRFLRCILYFCTASNIFWVVASVLFFGSGPNKDGVIFAIIYGVGCALNLVSDVTMLYALRNPSQAKQKFRLFLIWNTLSTCGCYVTDLFFSDFSSKNVCILYALYQVYQNYDRLAAYEEQNRAPQPGIFSNAPPVPYRFQPGSQSGVPVMPTGPALLAAPASGYPKMTPVPAGFPSTRPAWSGMPRSSGQPHRVAVQQPHLPEQQQPAPSTQPQFFASSGIVHVPCCSATQPQLTVDQPAMGQGAIAEATATEAEDTECPPDKTGTPETPSSGPCTPNQANSKQDAQVETKPATAAPSDDKVPHVAGSRPSPSAQAARTLSTINGNTRTQNIAKAASTGSLHVSGAASQETVPGDKPRRNSSRRSMATRSVPKFLIAKHGGRICAEI
ncbi:mediator of DNA damage checkpoint protein 1-like isoform X2 [Dermacentor albipictus]|uniref:mediator of DNA damage checkpoint protein 1-like isoform X2 n=1 Tax=Dermacentor albipictus TaxID=60249 RepID=UPI0031FCE4CA